MISSLSIWMKYPFFVLLVYLAPNRSNNDPYRMATESTIDLSNYVDFMNLSPRSTLSDSSKVNGLLQESNIS